jgi:ABC-type proline/glycine betaine transport system ATPase subunit
MTLCAAEGCVFQIDGSERLWRRPAMDFATRMIGRGKSADP